MPTTHIGITIFDDVEVLDFAGPFEVFSTASRVARRLHPDADASFAVTLIGHVSRQVTARAGFRVTADATINDAPSLDLLLVPGGVVDTELERREVIEWIRRADATTQITASVCTGAFLLAEAGLLDGRQVTTHWEDIPDLRARYPQLRIVNDARFVEDGKFVTSAGISAGLDMSLHLVAKIAGEDLAVRTARQMDYAWVRERG
ncbi:MAG: DJ-1/PfpI family protein [Deltaproteobacteria bacterium]|nr:DJ-1/PfpI family protein [Deltaproteobacteria bacterium]